MAVQPICKECLDHIGNLDFECSSCDAATVAEARYGRIKQELESTRAELLRAKGNTRVPDYRSNEPAIVRNREALAQ